MSSQHKINQAALFVLAFIMLINALAYGTIIPLLYPYAARFGISPFGLSLLFAGFSLAQFVATPILGRLSDRFGRKPVLLFCLFGTSLSLALFASATTVPVLFIARIIDGITGGNISVAQAMIADTTKGNERAKAFAMLGAAFGFGFLAGPALGGIMSQYGLAAPFWFSAFLALIGTILGVVILKETLPAGHRQPSNKPLFDLAHIVQSLFSPLTGIILLLGFLSSLAQNSFFIGFQLYTNDKLHLSPTQIGLMFGAIGLVNIITQAFGIRLLLNKVPNKKLVVTFSLLSSGVMVALLAFHQSLYVFVFNLLVFAVLLSPVVPVVTGLLSERVKGEDQGGILGVNQSYTSLGQILGPLLAGVVAARLSVQSVFVLCAAFLLIGFIATFWLKSTSKQKFDL
jgi:multidrug resistance protein